MPQYDLTLRDYWRIIQKRRFVLVVIFLTVLITTIICANLQKSFYRASAQVRWAQREALGGLLIGLLGKGKMGYYDYSNTLQAQLRIITGIPVLEKVVVELGLAPKDASQQEIVRSAGALQGAVSAEIINNTDIIRITAVSTNPEKAALIANKIAQVYMLENLREKNKQSRSVREFIERQLTEVTSKLKDSEDSLAKFKDEEVPTGIAISLQNKLAELNTERENLLEQYTEKHPDVKNTEEQINSLKAQLKGLPYKELEYSRLQREVEINSKLYRELKDRLEVARIEEAEKISDTTLVDSAVPAVSPVRPNKPFNYFLGAVIGLMLGLIGVFVFEQLDTSIGTVEEVETNIGLPILGVIPFSPSKRKTGFIFSLKPHTKEKDRLTQARERLIIYPDIQSSVVEAYHMLDTNICLSFEDKASPKVIIISSTAPEEGKTLIASNLAITMAGRLGRVLLIDADLRKPVVHSLFGLQREPGLSDILAGTHKLKNVLKDSRDLTLELRKEDSSSWSTLRYIDNLHFITAGHLPDNPAGLLTSEHLSTLINELRSSFDMVIFDSSPILAVSDVSILSPKVDAAVLVYQVGKTARSALLRSKKQLESRGAKIKGIVLNCLNPQMEVTRSYYYYHRYYGKKEEKVEEKKE